MSILEQFDEQRITIIRIILWVAIL